MANNIAIDTNQIQSMVEKMRSVASRTQFNGDAMSGIVGQLRQTATSVQKVTDPTKVNQANSVDGVSSIDGTDQTASVDSSKGVDFAQVLKSTLDQVNESQSNAQKLSDSFSMGDDSVNLSDVMIAMQKASISFQTSVQVRNRLVSAYRDIMTMQI